MCTVHNLRGRCAMPGLMEHERKRLEAMEECVEYLSMLLAEIDSLCD